MYPNRDVSITNDMLLFIFCDVIARACSLMLMLLVAMFSPTMISRWRVLTHGTLPPPAGAIFKTTPMMSPLSLQVSLMAGSLAGKPATNVAKLSYSPLPLPFLCPYLPFPVPPPCPLPPVPSLPPPCPLPPVPSLPSPPSRPLPSVPSLLSPPSCPLTPVPSPHRFTRLITGSDLDPDNPQDLDLSNDYYALFGVRPSDPVAAGSFLPHVLGGVGNPRVSAQQINPSTSQGNFEADETGPRLIRAHGIMMLIAWPLMAVMAIFFAAWMRPALPNGEWFQVHRLLMSGSIFVASIGFILIFVANRNNDPPGLISFSNNVSTLVNGNPSFPTQN